MKKDSRWLRLFWFGAAIFTMALIAYIALGMGQT